MAEEPIHRRLQLVSGEEPFVPELDRLPASVLRAQEQFRPMPAWTDFALVLGVCIPFWAGLTWLVSAWL